MALIPFLDYKGTKRPGGNPTPMLLYPLRRIKAKLPCSFCQFKQMRRFGEMLR